MSAALALVFNAAAGCVRIALFTYLCVTIAVAYKDVIEAAETGVRKGFHAIWFLTFVGLAYAVARWS